LSECCEEVVKEDIPREPSGIITLSKPKIKKPKRVLLPPMIAHSPTNHGNACNAWNIEIRHAPTTDAESQETKEQAARYHAAAVVRYAPTPRLVLIV